MFWYRLGWRSCLLENLLQLFLKVQFHGTKFLVHLWYHFQFGPDILNFQFALMKISQFPTDILHLFLQSVDCLLTLETGALRHRIENIARVMRPRPMNSRSSSTPNVPWYEIGDFTAMPTLSKSEVRTPPVAHGSDTSTWILQKGSQHNLT